MTSKQHADRERGLALFVDDMLAGRIDRRQVLRRAILLGVSLPALAALVRQRAVAQEATPVATPDASPVASPGATPSAGGPPTVEMRPETRTFSGVAVEDPYFWLEDPTDPAVIAYLEAENAYAESVLAPAKTLQDALYKELTGRIQRTTSQVPFRMGDYLYYTRTVEGLDYEIVARKRGSLDAAEEILLDLNVLKDELAVEYIELGYYAPSYDHLYLAYGLNTSGGLEYITYVKDLQSGETLPDQLPGDGYAFEWAGDNRTIFYARQDEALRSFELYRHLLGTDLATDPMLYREEDDVFSLGLYYSDDKRYLFLNSGSYESSETRTLPMDQPEGDWTLFAPRRPGILYSLEHHGEDFLVLTNDGAVNFKLMAAPVANPAPANWRELIPHRDSVLLEHVDAFERHLVVAGRENGQSQIFVRDVDSGATAPLTFDEPVYTVSPGDNREYGTTKFVFSYTSLVTPPSDYEFDMATGERVLLRQEEVVGGHDPSRYVSERIFATATDGTQVPISLVRLRDGATGPRPLRLDGYGSYGISSDPTFVINRLALIDRGITYAIAHIRGGQELGRLWYEDGKLLNKKNTFTDYVACAEHLIAEGYTAPDRLVANGGSAGGLLIGAVANARPDLFKLVIPQVPFVDVLRVMLDPSLPLTTGEYVEWGNPAEATYYDYIKSYSPYDNIRPQAYPAMFVTGGLEDDQVPYWQPAKWTAKLRATKTDDNPLLLRTNLGAGHQGQSGFSDREQEIAFLYTFVLMTLGLETAPASANGRRPAIAAPDPEVYRRQSRAARAALMD